MKIYRYKQFNESYNLELSIEEKNSIEEIVSEKINSMDDYDINSTFNELEKIVYKLNCTMEDLLDPIFVKEHLSEMALSVIEEGFFNNMKEKIYKILTKVFQWGSAIGSIIMIVINATAGSYWGVFLSAIALTISILAGAYIGTKVNQRGK